MSYVETVKKIEEKEKELEKLKRLAEKQKHEQSTEDLLKQGLYNFRFETNYMSIKDEDYKEISGLIDSLGGLSKVRRMEIYSGFIDYVKTDFFNMDDLDESDVEDFLEEISDKTDKDGNFNVNSWLERQGLIILDTGKLLNIVENEQYF